MPHISQHNQHGLNTSQPPLLYELNTPPWPPNITTVDQIASLETANPVLLQELKTPPFQPDVYTTDQIATDAAPQPGTSTSDQIATFADPHPGSTTSDQIALNADPQQGTSTSDQIATISSPQPGSTTSDQIVPCPFCAKLCTKQYFVQHVSLCIKSPKRGRGETSQDDTEDDSPPAKKIKRNPKPSHAKRKTKHCDICNQDIASRFDLHIRACKRKQEKQNKKFVCPTCSKELKSQTYLKKHIAVCTPKHVNICAHCNRTVKNAANFKRHVEVCAKPKQKTTRFQCTKCLTSFHLKKVYDMHVACCESGETYPSKMTCPTCNRHFDHHLAYDRHLHLNSCRSNEYLCNHCGVIFKNRHSFKNHSCTNKHKCDRCGKEFQKGTHLTAHRKSCAKELHKCTKCTRGFDTRRERDLHERQCGASANKRYKCHQCQMSFSFRHQLYRHMGSKHKQKGTGELQTRPWDGNASDAPWVNDNGEIDQDLADTYEADEHLILAPSRVNSLPRVYNFPVRHDVQLHDVMDFVRSIRENEENAFRINLAFGFILRNRETGRYRYFRPYYQQGFMTHPFRIASPDDIRALERHLKSKDFFQEVLNKRPNTKWEIELLTNLHAIVYPLDFAAGAVFNSLPDFISSSKSIVGLDVDYSGAPYQDYLCIFRCLAYHRTHSRYTDVEGRSLFKEYSEFCRLDESTFKGIAFEDISEFEECFAINVMVYCLDENKEAATLYKSPYLYEDTMYLNLFDQHFSYISNIDAYCHRFKCSLCRKLFKIRQDMQRHEAKCEAKTTFRYPGGFYAHPGSIFDEAESIGIFVPQADRFNPFLIVYDMESRISSIDGESQYISEHTPISVAIASTVPGFTEVESFVNADSNLLIKDMATYMTEVATTAEILLREKWCIVFEKISQLLEIWQPDGMKVDDDDLESFPDLIDILESDVYGTDEDKSDENVNAAIQSTFYPNQIGEVPNEVKKSMYRRIKNFRAKFERFTMQVPCLGFNSSFYESNVAIKHLILHFDLTNKKVKVIKKNNKYLCLSTERFRFLDIMQYLPQNTSYSEFLKAFQIPASRKHFPIEYIDSFDKLYERELPPVGSAWFSMVKGGNILDDGVDTIDNNFRAAALTWQDKNMENLLDYLRWYNSNNVVPLLEGVEKVRQYYTDKRICVFTSTISLPGCARALLFRAGQEAGGTFAVFDHQNRDLYGTFKQSLVGGPSKLSR